MMYRGERARACVCVHKRNVTCDRIGYLPGLTERPGREEKQAREGAHATPSSPGNQVARLTQERDTAPRALNSETTGRSIGRES